MGFSDTTFAKGAFKALHSLAHTSNDRDPAGESILSGPVVQDGVGTIAEAVSNSLATAIAAGVVEVVTFDLVEVTGSNNKGFEASFPTGYSAGGGHFGAVDGELLRDHSVAIPKTYSVPINDVDNDGYNVIVKNSGGTTLSAGDASDWFWDEKAGVVTAQDPTEGAVWPPSTIKTAIYTGDTVRARFSDVFGAGYLTHTGATATLPASRQLALGAGLDFTITATQYQVTLDFNEISTDTVLDFTTDFLVYVDVSGGSATKKVLFSGFEAGLTLSNLGGVLDISAQSNLAVTAPIVLTGDTLSLGTVDISANTNLAVTAPVVLTGDTLSLQADLTAIEALSDVEGFLRKTAADTWTLHKSNLTATVAPASSDDSGSGYSVGSLWIDVTADKSYFCVDATAAAAVWNDLTAGGGGGETNTGSNVNVSGIGVFDGKVGVDLQFRGLLAASTKFSVSLDAVNNEIDLDVVEANFTLDDITNDVIPIGNAGGTGIEDGPLSSAVASGLAGLLPTTPGEILSLSTAANGDIRLDPGGTGNVFLGSSNQVALRIYDSVGVASGRYLGFACPTTITTYTLTFPAALGAAGEVLKLSSPSTGALEWGTGAGGGITSLGGQTGATQTFATGTAGTNFAISSAANVHTFDLPTASGTNTGKLSNTDWTTFNAKAPTADPVFTGSVQIPNAGGGPTLNAAGEIGVDTTSDTLNFHDGTAERVLSPVRSFHKTIERPINSEDLGIGFVDEAVTITKIVAVLVGSSTPSVTWTIRHGTDRSLSGAEVVTSGTTTTSTTTGSVVTSFNDATVVADSFLWLETTAKSGTVDALEITVFYRQDA